MFPIGGRRAVLRPGVPEVKTLPKPVPGADGPLSAHQAALLAVAAPVVRYGPRLCRAWGVSPPSGLVARPPPCGRRSGPGQAAWFLPVETRGVIGA